MDYSFAAPIVGANNNTQETNIFPAKGDSLSKIYFNLAENPNYTSAFDPFPSIFDSQEKFDSKQYHLFKKISPIKPLSLDLKSKLFEDIVIPIKSKDKPLEDVSSAFEMRQFHIYAHKNYKARLVFIENGGPKNYLNLNNFRMFINGINDKEKDDVEKGRCGFYLEKNNRRIGYYTSCPEITELWLSFLRNYCILKSFPFDFEIHESVRIENFCNVNFNLKTTAQLRQIYRAQRKSNIPQKFCVKIYNTNLYHNYDEVQKVILNEITILRQTHHISIISLHEVHEFRGVVFLVFEPFLAESLYTILKKNILIEESQKIKIMEKILRALKYMHSEGIIHRGINPSNILFRSEKNYGDVIIGDFSLAVYYNKENKFHFKQCGVPGYLAPEVLFGWKFDYKMDVFGAGAIFYLIIMEKRLFEGSNTKDIIKKNYEFQGLVKQDYEDRIVKINPTWLDLIDQMLKKFPEERISAMEALENQVFKREDVNECEIYLRPEALETQGTIPTEGASKRNILREFKSYI